MSDHIKLLQAISLSSCAAKAAGARGRAGDVTSAATLLQLHKWPEKHNTAREQEEQAKISENRESLFRGSKTFIHLLGHAVKPNNCSNADLSLFGQISGELGLDEVSDLTSCECGNASAVL